MEMVSTPRDAERPGFDECLPAALKVLRRSIEDLLDFFWDERYRHRACEQAHALSHAAKLEGRIRLFTLARSLGCLCSVKKEEALPVRREVAVKLRELMGELEKACGDSLEEHAG
jgi:hypothetical protein